MYTLGNIRNRNIKSHLILPVIPAPKEGTAAVIGATEGVRGALFKGAGGIDLHCGNCLAPVAEGMAPGQMKNLVLRCPHCNSHNAVIDIPVMERFVEQLQISPLPQKAIPKFKHALSEGLERTDPAEYISEVIENSLPELNWFKEYLVPSNAGETYAMLGFVLAFMTWYQTRPKKNKETPQTIINNYFNSSDPYKNIGRNDPCPCKSGKKLKQCHGKNEG